MMRRLLALGALILAGSIGNAEATTINFEDLAVAPGTEVFYGGGTDPISDGFLFDAASHSHVANRFWGTDNGSTHLVLDDVLGPDATTISPILGGPFALTSIDISEAHDNPFFSARQIEVTGNLFGGGTIFTLLALDNNKVNGVYANYFQTFTFGAGWGNLSSVKLNGIGALAGGGNYYAIDNAVVNAAAVPEPGTLSLLGLGFAYLFERRRRTRR
jgi:hypothetical protein